MKKKLEKDALQAKFSGHVSPSLPDGSSRRIGIE
jgi:hypothetical protein